MERKELFRALFGSDNYNLAIKGNPLLNIPASDKDYKVFVVPNFDDLYDKVEYSDSTITEKEDLIYSDVRKLNKVLTNMNWLEILFSKEVTLNKKLSMNEVALIDKLYSMRDEIVMMNLSYFFDSCMGMHIERVKRLHKYSASCKYMEDLYGYNVKEALHAYRILATVIRFAEQGFKDFEKALRFEGEALEKLLSIRHGEISEDFMKIALDGIKNLCNEKYAPLYHAFEKNQATEDTIKEIVYGLVRLNFAQGVTI
jgi:hypothetical protein